MRGGDWMSWVRRTERGKTFYGMKCKMRLDQLKQDKGRMRCTEIMSWCVAIERVKSDEMC